MSEWSGKVTLCEMMCRKSSARSIGSTMSQPYTWKCCEHGESYCSTWMVRRETRMMHMCSIPTKTKTKNNPLLFILIFRFIHHPSIEEIMGPACPSCPSCSSCSSLRPSPNTKKVKFRSDTYKKHWDEYCDDTIPEGPYFDSIIPRRQSLHEFPTKSRTNTSSPCVQDSRQRQFPARSKSVDGSPSCSRRRLYM
jgi:hypothetical protein